MTNNQLEQNQFINAVIDNAGALVVVLDREGRIVRFNSTCEKVSGYSEEEVQGKFPWDTVLPKEEADKIRKEAFDSLARQPDALLGKYTNSWEAKNGQRFLIEWTNTLLTDQGGCMEYMICIGIDITARKIAEEEQNRASQIINAMFDTTPVLIAYMDSDMNFIRVNQAYAEVDEKQPDEFVGKNHFDMYPNAENEKIFRQVIESGIPYTATAKAFEYEYTPDRGITHWDWTLTPVKDNSNRVTGLVLSLQDVTEHIRVQRELQIHRTRQQELINQATQKLQKSLAEKEVLLKEVHHRVKNNLAMVSAFIKLQMKKSNDSDAFGALHACNSRIEAMAMVHKKLYQSRDMTSINMHELFRDMVSSLYAPSEHGEMAIDINVDSIELDMDIAIPCALAVNELVSNSLKHAFDDLSGAKPMIRIDMSKQDTDSYQLRFMDNGCGMPENIELDNTDSLGLQLVNVYAGQLEGTLQLERDHGTHWHLTFPA